MVSTRRTSHSPSTRRNSHSPRKRTPKVVASKPSPLPEKNGGCCSPHNEIADGRCQMKKKETPSSHISRDAIVSFFFTVTCACNESKRFRHILVLSSLPFSVPAYLLLRQGTIFLGSLAAALTLTSIVYHATHRPWVRAFDVLLVWLVGMVGVAQGVTAIMTSPLPTYHFKLALLAVGLLNLINTQRDLFWVGDVIQLQWHACLHLLTTLALFGIARGYEVTVQSSL